MTTERGPDPERILDLVDYRRRVAELYLDARRAGVDETSWRRWVAARSELLRTHPQSPLDAHRRSSVEAAPFFDYDPSWHVVGTVEPLADGGGQEGRLVGEGSTWTPIGSVAFTRAGAEHRLGLYWLEGYGGGLFLPFTDRTSGDATYGGGRYLLDGPKSADLGGQGPDHLLLDFNFAYHPSCAWDERWACPLAPPGNRLDVEVAAGERAPDSPAPSDRNHGAT